MGQLASLRGKGHVTAALPRLSPVLVARKHGTFRGTPLQRTTRQISDVKESMNCTHASGHCYSRVHRKKLRFPEAVNGWFEEARRGGNRCTGCAPIVFAARRSRHRFR